MRVVVLIGARGVGKTSVAHEMLNKLPHWTLMSVGDGGWGVLAQAIQRLDSADMLTEGGNPLGVIIEAPTISPMLRAALQQHDATVIRVTCSERERRRRLKTRGVDHIDPASNPVAHVRFDATNVEPAGVQKLVELAKTQGKQRMPA